MKQRLINLLADIAWVRGYLEGYDEKLDDCCGRLDNVMVKLEEEIGKLVG